MHMFHSSIFFSLFRLVSGALIILFSTSFSTAQHAPPQDGSDRPEGPPPHMRGGPPPKEALEACVGKSEQSVCVVLTPHGEMSGICAMPQGSDSLACIIEGRKRRKGRPDKDRKTQSEASFRPPLRGPVVTASSGLDYLYPATETPRFISKITSRRARVSVSSRNVSARNLV